MRRLIIDAGCPDTDALNQAARILTDGGIVAYPTDTLYGLAVDPRNDAAVRKLFEAKGRPTDRAVPLVACDERQVIEQVGPLSDRSMRLARTFWPGPLSLIVPALASLAPSVHGSTGRVAVRVPNHVVARALARVAGHPLTATSANPSGVEAPSNADAVARTMAGVIDILLDAGPSPGGLPSTVVDATTDPPILLRGGALPWERVIESR